MVNTNTTTPEATDAVNLDEMCRLCLNRIDADCLIGIFRKDEKCSLSIRIMTCCTLEVQENDGLPTSICTECRQQLEKFYYFRQKSKNSDTKLRRHIRLVNAGKTSKVFAMAGGEDDEHEDDYIESRALFAKWDAERLAEDKKIVEEQKKQLQVSMDNAVRDVREQETKRIFEEARKHLLEEMALKEKAEQKAAKFRAAAEEVMRQAAAATELAKRQAVEMAAAEAAAAAMSEAHKIEYIEEESVGLEVQELILSDEPDYCDEEGQTLMEIVDESDEDAGDQAEPIAYDVMEGSGEEEEKQEFVAEAPGHITKNEVEISPNDGSEGADEEYTGEDTKSEIDQQAEYLEDVDGSVAETSAADDNQNDDEGENQSDLSPEQIEQMNESIRESIQSSTGIAMRGEFQYTILERRHNLPTKVEVTTTEGVIIEVALDCELDENGEKKIFHCNMCSMSFTHRIQLSRHLSVHDTRQGHFCGFCRKWFPSKSSLNRHVRVHTGEKPFQCTECDRSFIQKEILKRHLMIHTGERPFECSFCKKTFTQREFLRQHINRLHTENPVIKMHECPKCPKTFYHASGLSRHILIHSGRKFACSECSKTFSDKSAMNRHKVSLHMAQ